MFRVGHFARSVEATYLAAVFACGDGALLSGRAAGHLWGILKGAPPIPEVTAPTERLSKGIKTRRSRQIAPEDRARCRGIPVTSVARTVVDLAAVLPLDDLARVCHEAGVRYKLTPAQVDAVLSHRRVVPGAGKLRAVLRGEVPVTLSELEARFLKVLRRAGLPIPITNRPHDGSRLDCRWPRHRLTVELDSYTFHNSRFTWEKDRRREREAYARGDRFRRFTYGDVFQDIGPMLRELSTLLPSVVLPNARYTSTEQERILRRP